MNKNPHFPLTFIEVSHKGNLADVVRVVEALTGPFAKTPEVDHATRDHNISTVSFAIRGTAPTREVLAQALERANIRVVAINFAGL